ncbi:MAG: MBL fold metallo-hydrolase, partial [Thiohalorhabdaceae bacterium]
SAHRFEVTLHHDDDGEAGYADWWQVESLDGERLGRRDLAHPHGTRPFTRSTTLDLPADTRYVVVRGHDQDHGYGGQVAVVDLTSGAAERIRQGPEADGFDAYPRHGNAPGGELAVRVLGSGGPVLSNERASSGYVVYADGEPRLLVDAGGGTAARMGEAGVDASRIDAYLLTHLHIDHSADLPAILKSAYFQGRGETPVAIVGPTGGDPFPGTEAWVEGMFGPEGGVFSYMDGFARKVADGALNLQPKAVPADPAEGTVRTVHEIGDITVKAVAVKHGPMPALAFRVERDGRAVTFSGDLNGSTGHLNALAAGSDLLIHDAALNPDVPQDSVAAKLHAHPREIAKAASAAG